MSQPFIDGYNNYTSGHVYCSGCSWYADPQDHKLWEAGMQIHKITSYGKLAGYQPGEMRKEVRQINELYFQIGYDDYHRSRLWTHALVSQRDVWNRWLQGYRAALRNNKKDDTWLNNLTPIYN